MEWNERIIDFSVAHAKCSRAKRRDLWLELATNPSGCPRTIIGDFNVTLFGNERRGLSRFFLGAASEFGAMVDATSMIQIPSSGRKFTWSNNRRSGNVVAVLDRTFVNEDWLNSFDDCSQKILPRIASDHAPLLKLKSLKLAIKSWSRRAFPNLNREVDSVKIELEAVQSRIEEEGYSEHLFDLEAVAKTRFWKAIDNHENYGLKSLESDG
ncbi:uncharacterized protein LOC122086849 [Macadamia integrifolia]|uniref:uncharacterized protein LOC122086849 n=1 Tax=Macadamia integrifolia TaxID=60698 RepID=UPI001C4F0943|nr:uncharacterized protein LOC122086849 [Macadamia integrifolia]